MKNKLILIALAIFCISCGDPVAPTPIIEPSPSPSPTPTPIPLDICDALRADIFANVNGKNVYAWGLGEIATLEAKITYRGDITDEDTSDCQSLTVVTWELPHAPQPYCEGQGNLNSSRIRLQCFEPGTITVKATPQGFTILPAEANFRVQP